MNAIIGMSYLALETDFRPQLRLVADYRPDVVFVPGSFTDATLIAGQASALGLDVDAHRYYVIVEVLQEGWYQSHPDHYVLEPQLNTGHEKLGEYGHKLSPHEKEGHGDE